LQKSYSEKKRWHTNATEEVPRRPAGGGKNEREGKESVFVEQAAKTQRKVENVEEKRKAAPTAKGSLSKRLGRGKNQKRGVGAYVAWSAKKHEGWPGGLRWVWGVGLVLVKTASQRKTAALDKGGVEGQRVKTHAAPKRKNKVCFPSESGRKKEGGVKNGRGGRGRRK